mmetsp:Transcript_526/g.1926  ORF Transcript_526/g.1926 Transcript_526/m.1926 type:complete len:224 (+) Transcript_526:928-1599(+)
MAGRGATRRRRRFGRRLERVYQRHRRHRRRRRARTRRAPGAVSRRRVVEAHVVGARTDAARRDPRAAPDDPFRLHYRRGCRHGRRPDELQWRQQRAARDGVGRSAVEARHVVPSAVRRDGPRRRVRGEGGVARGQRRRRARHRGGRCVGAGTDRARRSARRGGGTRGDLGRRRVRRCHGVQAGDHRRPLRRLPQGQCGGRGLALRQRPARGEAVGRPAALRPR